MTPGHKMLRCFPSFPWFRLKGMVGEEACLPSNADFPWTPDYTLSFRVHVCPSEYSNLTVLYRFMNLLYGLGTLTTDYLHRNCWKVRALFPVNYKKRTIPTQTEGSIWCESISWVTDTSKATICIDTLTVATDTTILWTLVYIWEVQSRQRLDIKKKIWAASWQNQQNGMCAQRRLRSAWASVQSDQSLCCALNGELRTPAFIMRTAKTLIRLGGCRGWSESSLGVQPLCWLCHEAAHVYKKQGEIYTGRRDWTSTAVKSTDTLTVETGTTILCTLVYTEPNL